MTATAQIGHQTKFHKAEDELPQPVYEAWSRGDVGAATTLLTGHLAQNPERRQRAVWTLWQKRMGHDPYPLWVGLGACCIYAAAWGLALWAQNF